MNEVELTISARQREPSGLRLVATLVVTATISAVALSGVYQVTQPTIQANKARELRLGVFKVVPGSQQLQRLFPLDGALVPAPGDAPVGTELIYGAYDADGAFRGYAIVGETPGFQDTIRLLYGYDPARRRVIGMHVLLSRETPGLGDKIYKDEDFVQAFSDLAIEPEITVVNDGRDEDHEVDAITGATISSKAVVKIINTGNARWLPLLPAPGAEPALEPVTSPEEPDGD